MKKTLTLLMTLAVLLPLHAVDQNTRFAGGDISLLPSYEQYKTPYKDAAGNTIADVLAWMKNDCGWNTFRVRLFVNPSDPNQEGVVQDLDYVKALGKRIKEAGAYFMLDFHYSDTWVDATHIQAPAAWKGRNAAQMADTLGKYTAMVLDELTAYGAQPDLVQVGNEIMYGLCGIKVHPYAADGDDWDGYTGLLKAGCNAVREKCPNAQIIIHTDRPTNSQYNQYFYQKLIDKGVDFDIIGLSYYPFWHGYLTDAQVASKTDKNNLGKALSQLAVDFPDKEVQIVETAYNYQYWPTSGVNYNTQDVWPCSKVGQYNFVRDLVAELKNHPNVTGINYWFPEENGNGGASWSASTIVIKNWLSRGLWDPEKDSQNITHTLNTGGNSTKTATGEIGSYATPSTAIEQVEALHVADKRIVNGQLLITRGEAVYTILGQKK